MKEKLYIHIFTDEGLYSKAFIEFYEKNNFPLENVLFVFRSNKGKNNYSKILNDHITYIPNSKKFIKELLPKLLRSKKIFIHYLPIGPSLFIWYLIRFILHKAIWIIWGSDLYFFRDRENNLRDKTYEFLRRRIIKKIGTIACFIKGDYELAKDVYDVKAEYQHVVYPLPTNFEELEQVKIVPNQRKIKILVGNSASSTNHHIEALNSLAKFKDEDIEIYLPLSYGNENNYSESIVQYGRKIFSNKIVPMLDILTPVEYSNFLSGIDIAIMNHKRQQGLGNILSLLFLGKKVFIRKEITSFSYFFDIGVKVNEIEEIDKLSFKDFVSFEDQLKKINRTIIKEKFSNTAYKNLWEVVLFN